MSMVQELVFGDQINFLKKKIPVTIFGVGLALKNNPEVCEAIKKGNYEIAAHGYRWIDYQDVKKSIEKKHMQQAVKTIKDIFGSRPLGWYTVDVALIQEIQFSMMAVFYMTVIAIVMIYHIGNSEVEKNNL